MTREELDDVSILTKTLTEEDRVASADETSYKDSPFYHFFKKEYDEVVRLNTAPSPTTTTADLKKNGLEMPGSGAYFCGAFIYPRKNVMEQCAESVVQ